MRTDGQMDMTKLIVDFLHFALIMHCMWAVLLRAQLLSANIFRCNVLVTGYGRSVFLNCHKLWL